MYVSVFTLHLSLCIYEKIMFRVHQNFSHAYTNMKNRSLVTFTLLIFFIVAGVTHTTSLWAKDYTFSWAANNGSIDGYKLYYKKNGAAAAPFNGSDASEGCSPIDIGDVTSYTISGLKDNTTYHFTLTAYSGTEESDFTPVITVFPEQNYSYKLRAMHLVYRLLLSDFDDEK